MAGGSSSTTAGASLLAGQQVKDYGSSSAAGASSGKSSAAGASSGLPVADMAPPRHASWQTAGLLIIADVVGLGVMGVADSFAQLGWVMGVAFVVLMLPLNVYCGYLTWEAQVQGPYPASLSLAHIALYSHGNAMHKFTAVLVYSSIFLILGDYILCLGLCLEQTFYWVALSRAYWSLFACIVLAPFCQVRTLNSTKLLLYINAASIVIAIALCLGYLISEGQEATLAQTGGTTEAVAQGLTWDGVSRAIGKFAFAYTGVLMYPEIIAEMAQPTEFPKAQMAGAPFQLSAFLLVGCVGYAYLGSGASGLLITAIPDGAVSQVTAVSLFVHLLITYLIKGTVLTRALHRWLAPGSVNDFSSFEGTLTWAALSCSLLAGCYGVASAVPFFDELTSLIGCLQMSVVGFCLPVLFATKARRDKGEPPPWPLLLLFFCILAFGTVLAVVGTAASVVDIVTRWQDGTL